jgi:hypothetical protein
MWILIFIIKFLTEMVNYKLNYIKIENASISN